MLQTTSRRTDLTRSKTETLLPTGLSTELPSAVKMMFPWRYTVPMRFENWKFDFMSSHVTVTVKAVHANSNNRTESTAHSPHPFTHSFLRSFRSFRQTRFCPCGLSVQHILGHPTHTEQGYLLHPQTVSPSCQLHL